VQLCAGFGADPCKSMAPYRVLFVCLGNICRSPLAEGLFLHELAQRGIADRYVVDSAGTGNYHLGELADPRTRANAEQHGITLTHRSRQFKVSDFEGFDLILVMDRQNLERVLHLARNGQDEGKVALLRTYDPMPDDGHVPDPWFGGEEGFETVFQILKRSTTHLLTALEARRG
jgi:protein-tyrosine phosphatase